MIARTKICNCGHLAKHHGVIGCVICNCRNPVRNGTVAQLAERSILNRGVDGSIPSGPTIPSNVQIGGGTGSINWSLIDRFENPSTPPKPPAGSITAKDYGAHYGFGHTKSRDDLKQLSEQGKFDVIRIRNTKYYVPKVSK